MTELMPVPFAKWDAKIIINSEKQLPVVKNILILTKMIKRERNFLFVFLVFVIKNNYFCNHKRYKFA